MKLLITGGAGYIGSHVVLAAIEKGYQVTIFDDLSTGNEKNINKECEFVKGSTKSISALSGLFKDRNFDAVIHLAGKKAAGESMNDPIRYAEDNIIGSLNLINFCIENKATNLIFSSSASVYGVPKFLPINEQHSLSPMNYYGFTKLSIENHLKWFSNLIGFRYVALRYFNAAGYDIKKRVLGLEKNPQNLIPILMEVAKSTRTSINIYGNDYDTDDGTGVRDYIHVTDLAAAHIDALNHLVRKKNSLVVNLGSGKGYSVLDIINMTSKISKKEIQYEIVNRRKGDISTLIADSSLANELLGWEARFSDLKTIIKSTWSAYEE